MIMMIVIIIMLLINCTIYYWGEFHVKRLIDTILKDEQRHFMEMQDELNVLMKKKKQMVEELVEIE